MGRGPAVSQEPFTACASSPYPLRTPPGSSASIASKPAILAKIMHRRPAADLSDGAADPGVMHAVRAAQPRTEAPLRLQHDGGALRAYVGAAGCPSLSS
jgi:hypothetical protein